MDNRVKELRTKIGLSQKALALEVGVSTTTIQRIENGKQAAPVPTAKAICHVLGKSINVVFPGAGKALDDLVSALESKKSCSEALEKVRKTGVEADPREYIFKVILRGHREPLFFNISAAEEERLFRVVQRESSNAAEESFIVFGTDKSMVAINLRRLSFCHFLWEPGLPIYTKVETDDEEALRKKTGRKAILYLNDDPNPLSLDAEWETNDPDDIGDFTYMFNMLQSSCNASERFHFQDSDGEHAFIRVGDITLLEVPTYILDEEEREAIFDDEEDDAHDPQPVKPPRGIPLTIIHSKNDEPSQE